MVGIVKVDTLQNNAGTSSVGMDYVVNGSAKALSKQSPNGTQVSATSLNISSVTDGATGINIIAFANVFNSASETISTGSCNDEDYNRTVAYYDNSASQTESRAFRTHDGSLIDDFDFSMIVYGNLA